MEERTAERVVKEKWPRPNGSWDWDPHGNHYYVLYSGIGHLRIIGMGNDKAAAWADAAQRIQAEGAQHGK